MPVDVARLSVVSLDTGSNQLIVQGIGVTSGGCEGVTIKK